MNQHPSAGIAFVLISLVLLIFLLRFVQLKTTLHPESIRKILHLVMGLVTLAFPWIFNEAWPVFILAFISMLLFSMLRFYPPLNRSIGSVLYSIKRDSMGEFFFPLGVAALFYLADGNALLYSVSILALVVGDTAAALVGIRFGRLYYHSFKGKKTVEGSLAFFIITSLITFVLLQLFSDINNIHALLISLNLGIMLALVEASGSKGSDNFFIPIVSILVIENLIKYNQFFLSLILTGLICLSIVLYVLRGIRTNVLFSNDHE